LTRVELDHLADSIEQLTGLEPASEADTAAVGNRVASANVRAENSLPPMRREVADAQDGDGQDGDGTPETMELQIQEIGYRATLQALPKALPPSLASFLR
jgi:flagellar hook-associated protein 3 FlgL